MELAWVLIVCYLHFLFYLLHCFSFLLLFRAEQAIHLEGFSHDE